MRAGTIFVVASILATISGTATSGDISGVCTQDGGTPVICGQRRAEDLFPVSGTPWVIASWMDDGLVLIDARDKTTSLLFPSPDAKIAFDAKTYATCPGAPGIADHDNFAIAGISVRRIGTGRYKLYAVRMGAQAGVHVLDLDMRGGRPVVTWVGCVPAPGTEFLNSVVSLPDGGFYVTHFRERGPTEEENRARMERGEDNGDVMEWHPEGGWSKVPGSVMSGANGIELSPDRKWLYVNAWGRKSFYRIALGANPPRRDELKLGFHPDNIRWDRRGRLLVAGQADGRSYVVRIDPAVMRVEPLVDRPDSDLFRRSTVAIDMGKEMWVSSSRTQHILVLPAPK